MMKLIIPTTTILLPLIHNPQTMLLILITLMLLLLTHSLTQTNLIIWSPMMFSNNLTLTMLMLTLISTALIIMSSTSMNSINKTIPLILILLIPTFTTSNALLFYITFELTLIPTLILITSKGKQPERIQAGTYLLMYTNLASIPLLISILHTHSPCFLLFTTLAPGPSTLWPLILAFLVKMPMFLTHLWLPKAHVEAPLEGSMILASTLLKMGGYGLIRFIPLIPTPMAHFNHWLISISTLGSLSASLNCIRQKDLKALIAYSSVAHMALVIACLATMNSKGINGAIAMMISHGLSSSALFFLVNSIYANYHTRTILNFKGILSIFPNLSLWWMAFIMMNMSAPPSTGTMSEILIITSMLEWNTSAIMLIITSMMMTALFSINLFINSTHNSSMLMKPAPPPMPRTFNSLTTHLIPLILMTMKMELMTEMYILSLTKTMMCGIIIKKIKKMALPMITLSLMTMLYSILLFSKDTTINLEYMMWNNSLINIPINFILDWTALLFSATILMITAMILVYSKTYIPKNETPRFSILLLLFMTSMIMLVFSNNLISIILGWDGLGFSSYILVAYYQNFSSSASSSLTIFSNRIGDLALMTTTALLLLNSTSINSNTLFPLMTTLLLTLAAVTKSAQFPFSAWLPAAMAAPTPISALVHSSTLVTAGVYLMIRMQTDLHPSSSLTLMLLSSFTALMAGALANWEQDMKKIIALSTLSQIAMMLLSISMGAHTLALMHLIIHAMFKSTMFMCAGILINTSSYQDNRFLSPTNSVPITSLTLGTSSLALMGLPFMSGFYSKDSILEHILSKNNTTLSLLMLISIGLTCTYSARMSHHASKNFIKMKPNTAANPAPMENPLLFMNLTSIFLGSLMAWSFLPAHISILSPLKKMSILPTIASGLILGSLLTFKSKSHIKLSEMFTSLWFNHTLSTHTLTETNNIMKTMQTADKSWIEIFGPQGLSNLITSTSTSTTNLSYALIPLTSLTLMLSLLAT